MSDTDLAAARLLERLLTEPDFRVRFRQVQGSTNLPLQVIHQRRAGKVLGVGL